MHGDTKKGGCLQVSPWVSPIQTKHKTHKIHHIAADSHKYASLPPGIAAAVAVAAVQTPRTVAGFERLGYVTADIEETHAFREFIDFIFFIHCWLLTQTWPFYTQNTPFRMSQHVTLGYKRYRQRLHRLKVLGRYVEYRWTYLRGSIRRITRHVRYHGNCRWLTFGLRFLRSKAAWIRRFLVHAWPHTAHPRL